MKEFKYLLNEALQKSTHEVTDDNTKKSIIKAFDSVKKGLELDAKNMGKIIALLKKDSITPEEWGTMQSNVNVLGRQANGMFSGLHAEGTTWMIELKKILKANGIKV